MKPVFVALLHNLSITEDLGNLCKSPRSDR